MIILVEKQAFCIQMARVWLQKIPQAIIRVEQLKFARVSKSTGNARRQRLKNYQIGLLLKIVQKDIKALVMKALFVPDLSAQI